MSALSVPVFPDLRIPARRINDQNRLPEDRYWQTFFRWAHPKIAQYCHRNKLPYPEISREDGEIIDPSGWYAQVRKDRDAEG